MSSVGIAGIGIVAPGIESWQAGRQSLISDKDYSITADFPVLKPDFLSANERRRMTDTIKLALQCAQDAMSGQTEITSHDTKLASVFACSCGDLGVVDKILNTLMLPGKPVSPTHFHNSVHNAPAGYWSIATGSSAATNSIAAGEHTFSAGLLEAVTRVHAENQPVLLIVYDSLPPEVLINHQSIKVAFGMAMLIVPSPGEFSLTLEIQDGNSPLSKMDCPGFEQLRQANPAAHCLPLLQSIAMYQSAKICLPYLHDRQLALELIVND